MPYYFVFWWLFLKEGVFISKSKLYLNQHETRYTAIAFSHTITNALKCWSENLCIRQNIGTNSNAIFCINQKYFCTGNCIDIQERKVYSKSLTWLFWNLEMKFSQASMKLFICKSWKLLLHFLHKDKQSDNILWNIHIYKAKVHLIFEKSIQ